MSQTLTRSDRGDTRGVRLLGSRSFRRLLAAQTVSRWGDTFNTVALVILVFALTGSGFKVATTVVFEIVPVLILGPIAGAVADRHPRVKVMISADLVRAGLMVVLTAAPHRLWLIYVVAFGMSSGSVFFNPASGALLPSIVEDAQLVRANSAMWSIAVTSQIVLAPLAGILVATAGARWAFAINAASFVISAALLRGLPASVAASTGTTRLRGRVREGLSLARHNPLVRLLLEVQLLAALSAGATSAMLVVLARERLGVGPAGFGGLLSAIGIGAALGPLLLSRVADARRGRYLFGPYLLRGGVDAVLATTRTAPLAAGALVAYGMGTSTGTVVFSSIVQSKVAPEVRGRAFALFDVTWQTGRLVSLIAGGLLADLVGVAAVFGIGSTLLIIAGARGLLGAKRIGLG